MRSRVIIAFVLGFGACRSAPFAEGTSVDSLRFAAGELIPRGSLAPTRADVDSFRTQWYSRELAAMGEQRLSAFRVRPLEGYRFTWLRSFDPPVSVRLYATISDTVAVVTQTSGSAMFEPPRLVRRDSIHVGTAEWESVRAAFDRAAFWSSRAEPAPVGGVDGAQWMIEGLRESRYHVMDRWSPSDTGSGAAFRRAALLMLRVAHVSPDSARIY